MLPWTLIVRSFGRLSRNAVYSSFVKAWERMTEKKQFLASWARKRAIFDHVKGVSNGNHCEKSRFGQWLVLRQFASASIATQHLKQFAGKTGGNGRRPI